jgi:hypothetical protein
MGTMPLRSLQLGVTRSSCRAVPPPRRRVARCLKCRSLDEDDSGKVDIDELAKLLSSKAAELRQNNAEPTSAPPPPAEVPTEGPTSAVCASAVHDATLFARLQLVTDICLRDRRLHSYTSRWKLNSVKAGSARMTLN